MTKRINIIFAMAASSACVTTGAVSTAAAQTAAPTVVKTEAVATSDLLNMVTAAIRNNDIQALPDFLIMLEPIARSEPETATGLRARNLVVEARLRMGQIEPARSMVQEALALSAVQEDASLQAAWLYLDAQVALRDVQENPDSAALARACLDKLHAYITRVRPAQAGGPLRASASPASFANAHLRRVELALRFDSAALALSAAEEALVDFTGTLVPAGLAPSEIVEAGHMRLAGAYIAAGQSAQARALISTIPDASKRGVAALNAAHWAGEHPRARAAFAADFVANATPDVPAEQLMSLVSLTIGDWDDASALETIPRLLGPEFEDRLSEYETIVVSRRPAVDRPLRSSESHALRLALLAKLWRAQSNTGRTDDAQATRTRIVTEFQDDLAAVARFGLPVN